MTGDLDRKALKILLAALDLEFADIADALGYQRGYVSNVLTGYRPPSDIFRAAFGELVAELLLGGTVRESNRSLPAAPLARYLARRAAQAHCKRDFYADLGLPSGGWNKRVRVPPALVDRVCCHLGMHPSEIYGREWDSVFDRSSFGSCDLGGKNDKREAS